MTSTELIKPQDVRAALIDGKVLDVVDPSDVQADMVRRILGAETIEEAAADFTATPMDKVADVPLEVTGIAWMKSSFEQGSPVYCLIRAHVNGVDREEVISCGGRTVMAFLLWAQEHKAMPFKAMFHKEQSNANPEYHFWTVKLA